MKYNLIAFAIPVLFLLVGLEYFIARKKQKKYFTFTSSISSISIGIAERLAQTFLVGYFILVFQFVYDHFALLKIEENAFSWVVLFIVTDFVWYWYHRLSHEINVLWGAHIVHHSSEDYNYTVSMRITIYQSFVRLLFGLILPIIGFPVPMLLVSISFLGVYQFFLHTRLIKKLGILEHVLVTPSNHRVHHGSIELYLDKNYGGILIVWDKLFGTYQPETETVQYGLTKQVNSNSFLWLHFHYWLELIECVKDTPGLMNKLKVLFGKPTKMKASYELKLRDRFLSETNLTASSINRRTYPFLYHYIVFQLLFSIALLFLLYLTELSFPVKWLFSFLITITIINCGAILEQKKWVFKLEVLRFLVLYILIISYSGFLFLLVFIPLLLLPVITDYTSFTHWYFNRLYKRK